MTEEIAAVELKNVSKVFGGNKVINDVNLVIPPRSFVTFLGPSGCGKTTLLRMISGFYEPDAGEVYIKGKRVDKLAPYARNTAMVFQEYALFPHLSVFENVAYGLRIQAKDRKLNEAQINEKVIEALSLMQLAHLKDRYPHQMSGGQQQRVAVARALVMNPDALLLDEPLSNLDAKLREIVRVELRQIQQQLQLTAIYVTHDQQEALAMSDYIVLMNKGIVQQAGSAQDIYYRPNSRFVADFIGTTNLIDVDIEGNDKARYHDVVIPLESGKDQGRKGKAAISIRPESIRIAKAADKNAFSLEVTIKQSIFLGEKTRYVAEDAFKKEWIIDSFDPGPVLQSGTIWITVEPSKPHVIFE
ncbi:ABC transporter ATP-binding protein [Microvirga sp. W0021]|uniref:ABC transporter ATP-binding protein n=1 Tax=Hohaiivirga grylli TaxID=3133970 RepID=A0ABV0BG96_9HYPH